MAHSDRKLNVDEFMAVRAPWLQQERRWLSDVQILRKRPMNYSAQYQFNWDSVPAQEHRMDKRLLVNIDEVPLSLHFEKYQYVVKGERVAICKQNLKPLSKYRKGTLVVFQNTQEILLVILIFTKQGGPVQARNLRKIAGSVGGRVIIAGTKSGSISKCIWRMGIEALALLTQKERGCEGAAGTDWKQALALYMDNCSTHLDQEIGEWAWRTFGIGMRPFLKNSSHLMQPVDRNVGQLLKIKMKTLLEKSGNDFQRLCYFMGRQRMKCPESKWHQLAVRAAEDAISQV